MHSTQRITPSRFIKRISSYERVNTSTGTICSIEDAFNNEVYYHNEFYRLATEFNSGIRVPRIISVSYPEIEMEMISGTSLIEADTNTLSNFPWHQLKAFIEYCESKGYYHNDLNEENLMVVQKADETIVYLIDYGMASDVNAEEYSGVKLVTQLQHHYSV